MAARTPGGKPVWMACGRLFQAHCAAGGAQQQRLPGNKRPDFSTAALTMHVAEEARGMLGGLQPLHTHRPDKPHPTSIELVKETEAPAAPVPDMYINRWVCGHLGLSFGVRQSYICHSKDMDIGGCIRTLG